METKRPCQGKSSLARVQIALRNKRGSSLVEVCIALTIAVISIFGVMGSLISGSQLQQQTQEYGRANRAIQQIHETLRNGDLDARVAEYKADADFDLGPISVQVRFPEQVLIDLLGGPVPVGWRYRDVDNDGEVDLDLGSTARASLVPVLVRTNWVGGELNSNFMVTQK
jgi:hypothetical protein